MLRLMVIVTRKHLSEAALAYLDAAGAIAAWVAVVAKVRWRTFVELRGTFPDADAVDGYVIFNILHNRYRLITVVHYSKDAPVPTEGTVYIRSFLTHKEYDNRTNWDRKYGQKTK